MPGVPEKMVVFQSSYIILDFVVYVYILLDAEKRIQAKKPKNTGSRLLWVAVLQSHCRRILLLPTCKPEQRRVCGFLELSRKNQYRSSNTP